MVVGEPDLECTYKNAKIVIERAVTTNGTPGTGKCIKLECTQFATTRSFKFSLF